MNEIQKHHLTGRLVIKFSDLDQETINYISFSDLFWIDGSRFNGQITPKYPLLIVELSMPKYVICHNSLDYVIYQEILTLRQFQEAIGMKPKLKETLEPILYETDCFRIPPFHNLKSVPLTWENLQKLDRTRTYYKVLADGEECWLNYSNGKDVGVKKYSSVGDIWWNYSRKNVFPNTEWFLHSERFEGYPAKVKLKQSSWVLNSEEALDHLNRAYGIQSLTVYLDENKDLKSTTIIENLVYLSHPQIVRASINYPQIGESESFFNKIKRRIIEMFETKTIVKDIKLKAIHEDVLPEIGKTICNKVGAKYKEKDGVLTLMKGSMIPIKLTSETLNKMVASKIKGKKFEDIKDLPIYRTILELKLIKEIIFENPEENLEDEI